MHRAGIEHPARHARAMYEGLGRGAFELLWLAGASAERRARAIASVPLDEDGLVRAVSRGPVVLCASHTGNWELAAARAAHVLARHGRRLRVVAKPFSSPGVDAFCTRLRARLGVDVVRPCGAMAAAVGALRDGDCVAMPIDQVPDRAEHSLIAPFLGESAFVDRAPAVVARRACVPMLVVANGRVLAEIPAPSSAHEARAAMRRATTALDAFVRSEPASWLWLHRRWRRPRGANRASNRPIPAIIAR